MTAGVLVDPYTGDTITTPREVDIDHVVPLAEMWRTGAATWPLDRRIEAANDLDNLLAVSARANRAKGDDTPDRWMPSRAEAHCDYATRYVLIKTRYDLTVTIPERDRLAAALATCPT